MKKIFFGLVFLIFLCLFSNDSYAANKYWVGPVDGSISDLNNWATTASACGTGTVVDAIPGATDVAFFTANCTNAAIINQAWSVAGINIEGGTITQSSALTVGTSNFTQTAGTFVGGSSAIDIAGSFSLTGGTMTSTSGILSVERNFTITSATFNHNSGTVALDGTYAGNTTINAPSINFNLVTISRTANGGGGTLTMTINSGTTLPFGDASPTILLRNSNIGAGRYDLNNNGTINFTGNGTLTFSLTTANGAIGILTNGATTGFVTGNSLTAVVYYSNITNNGSMSFTSSDSFDINGTLTNNSGATFATKASPTFAVSGSFVVNSNSTFPDTGVTLNLDGNNTATSVSIDASGITFALVTINRTVQWNSTFTMTVAANTILPLGNTPTISLNTQLFGTYNFVNNGTITVGTGTFTIDLVGSAGTIGTFINNGTINATNSTAISSNAHFINGSTGIVNGHDSLNFTTSANVTINSSSTFPALLGTITTTGTSFDNAKNTTYGSFVKNGATTLALVQGFTTGDFTISAGTISNPASLKTINLTGNFSQTGGTLGGSNLLFNFSGSNTQILNKTSGTFSSPFSVDKTGGVISLSSAFGNAAGQTCVVMEGIFDLNGQAFTCGSDFVIQNGGILRMMGTETPTAPILDTGSTVSFKGDGDAAPDTITITAFTTNYKNLSIDNAGAGGIDTFVLGAEATVDGNLTINSGVFDVSVNNYTVNISGNFAFNGGTFNARAGTINLNGASQSIDAATAVTFYNLTKNVVSAASLTLPSSKTVVVSNVITLTGTSGNLLTIQASIHETQSIINFPATQTMSYLAVHDINNIGTAVSTAGFNMTNLGNNLGFNFNVAPTVSALANITQMTDGSGYVSFTTTIADNDNDVTKLKVEYSDNGGTDWYDPVLISATPSVGDVVLNNSNAYQIESIDTNGGNVNLTIVWSTKSGANSNGSLDNLSPSNLQVRVIANDSSVDSSIATSSNFSVDNIKPTAEITYSTNDPRKAGSIITITATYSEVMADTPIPKVIISGANTLSATNMTKDTNSIYVYNHTVGAGNGNAVISLSTGTDLFGNVVVSTPTSGGTFVVDNIAPAISISDPSTILTKNGPVTYTVTYTNADSISLVVGNITLNKTGTADGVISLSGTGNSRTITVSAITGNGTLGVAIASGTASDIAGNASSGLGQEDTIVIDNTIPVITRVGKAVVKIYRNTNYTDAGANASDNVDGNITANIVTDGLPINTAIAGTYEVSYDVSDTVGNNASQVTRIVNVLEVPLQSQVLGSGATTTSSNPSVVIGDNDTTSQTIVVPSSVTNATINVSAMTVATESSTSALMPAALNIDVDTVLGTVSVGIPSGVEMVAQSNSWDGKINVPQVRENPSVTPTVEAGKTAHIGSVIEVGYGDTKLTFDKAVRVLIPGQAGKYIGYSQAGTFYQITTNCSADSQEAGDALPAEGDCKKDIGDDLVIWTKHFTEFTTYIKKTNPIITWADPSNVTVGTALSATQLNATANVSGTFLYTPELGTVLETGTRVLSVTFTPTDTTTYNTVTDTANIVVEAIVNTGFRTSSSRHEVPMVTTTTIPQQNNNQAVLINLMTLLKKLILEYKQIKGSIPEEWERFINPIAEKAKDGLSSISRDLYLNLSGDDVRMLQQFLIEQEVGEKALRLKKFGVTGYFGLLTKEALIEYQVKNKIIPSVGYFGRITREYLKSMGR